MSFEAERLAIENHFQREWTNNYASKDIWDGYKKADGEEGNPPANMAPFRAAYDNVAFNVPRPNLVEPQDSVWVRLTILPAGAAQITVGTQPILQHNGVISVQIFHPINARSNVMSRFADIVTKIFDLAALEVPGFPGVVVQCLRSTMVRVGPFNDWYQSNINTVYIRQGQEGQAGQSTLADRYIDYGVLADIDDMGTWIVARSPLNFFSSLSTGVLFPETTGGANRFWFEPLRPSRFAFGAVYNISLDLDGQGTYDPQWTLHNPDGDVSRVVYYSEPYPTGFRYEGIIHHLFEIA